MSLGIIAALLLLLGVAGAVGFFVLRRVVKWAVRLALLCAALALLLAGTVAWWWHASYSPGTRARPSNRGAAATPARRAR